MIRDEFHFNEEKKKRKKVFQEFYIISLNSSILCMEQAWTIENFFFPLATVNKHYTFTRERVEGSERMTKEEVVLFEDRFLEFIHERFEEGLLYARSRVRDPRNR